VELLFYYSFATHGTCLLQITDEGAYGTTPSQGMDPDDTKGHHLCGIALFLLFCDCTCLIQITDPDDTN
jgi:hypothetical protein